MPNNIMQFGPSRATARKFAAVNAARRGGPSRSTVRTIIFVFLASLAAIFMYLFVKIYSAPPPPPAAPPMGQWSLVKDEEVAVVKDVRGGGGSGAQKGLRAGVDEPSEEQQDGAPETTVEVTTIPRRPRKIVLSTGGGRINTGVWPNWGQNSDEVTLNWAAAGVVVKKQCPTKCIITHDQSSIADADAVMMELVNLPKFGIPESEPIPYPEPRRENPKLLLPGPQPTQIPKKLPLIGLFYYEAAQSWPKYTLPNPDVSAAVDFSMAPTMDSTLPITLICPWGRQTSEFLKVPSRDDKKPGRLVAYFNEHGISSAYRNFVEDFFQAAGDNVHAYQNRRNKALPPEADKQPYQLSNRLDFLSTYKFVLVTEAIEEMDFIEPEYSHAILAGAVPVYIGAPNIAEFVPGPRSIVHGRDFATGAQLWEYLQSFDADNSDDAAWERYMEFHAWKKGGMDAFMRDEMGQGFAIGTGQGVSRRIVPAAERVKDIEAWAAKPGADGKVPTLKQLQASNSGSFDDLAVNVWRAFRRHLDHCVHYAECRMCELVTLLT